MTGTWEQLWLAGYKRVTWPGWTGYLELSKRMRDETVHVTPYDQDGKLMLPIQEKYGHFRDRPEWIGVKTEQETS